MLNLELLLHAACNTLQSNSGSHLYDGDKLYWCLIKGLRKTGHRIVDLLRIVMIWSTVNVLNIGTVRAYSRKGKCQKICEGSNQFCKGRQLNCLLCKICYFPLLQWWGEKINLGCSFFFGVRNFRTITVFIQTSLGKQHRPRSEVAVWSGSTLCTFWIHLYGESCSSFRLITAANVFRCPKFLDFHG